MAQIERIQLILFTIMGVRLAMDLEFVSGLCELETADEGDISTFRFHEKLHFNMAPVEYCCPRVLLLKKARGRVGVVIDQPEDVNVAIALDEIKPLPPLIEAVKGESPLWGVTVLAGNMVLLVDPGKLLPS